MSTAWVRSDAPCARLARGERAASSKWIGAPFAELACHTSRRNSSWKLARIRVSQLLLEDSGDDREGRKESRTGGPPCPPSFVPSTKRTAIDP